MMDQPIILQRPSAYPHIHYIGKIIWGVPRKKWTLPESWRIAVLVPMIVSSRCSRACASRLEKIAPLYSDSLHPLAQATDSQLPLIYPTIRSC
jgi:hypothetical protein